jgi:hypothetical protein
MAWLSSISVVITACAAADFSRSAAFLRCLGFLHGREPVTKVFSRHASIGDKSFLSCCAIKAAVFGRRVGESRCAKVVRRMVFFYWTTTMAGKVTALARPAFRWNSLGGYSPQLGQATSSD